MRKRRKKGTAHGEGLVSMVCENGTDKAAPERSALLDGLQKGDDGTDLVGVKLNSGMSGWPDMMPSASASSRDSIG